MAQGQSIGNAYLTIKAKADDSFASGLEKMGGESGDLAGGLFNTKFGAALTKVVGVLGALGIGKMIGQFFADSINVGESFDKSMSQVAATMGTTVDEIGDLRDFAKEMGATTSFSATQAADALNYMALAGYDTKKSMEMLPNVLNLAASGNIDLARASDMVTDAASALGLETDETTVMVDQMAKTASTTNTSVEQLGDAFLTVGGTAKMLKGGTAELSQVLGVLADNGIKGSEGGTALRNILLSLASPTSEASETLSRLGVSVFDAEGNMRSMQDVMADLNDAMSDMTSEERTNAISSIFNARDLKSVEALLGTNAERWDEVADAIGNAQGAAEKMANTQLDNLAGDVTLMQSAFEGVQIAVSDFVVPALRAAAQFAGSLLQGIADFFKSHSQTFDGLAKIIGGVLNVALGAASVAFETLGNAVSVVFSFLDPIIEAISSGFDKITAALGLNSEETSESMGLWQMLGDVFGFVGDLIATVITPVISVLSGVISAVAEPVRILADKFSSLWNTVREVWDNIKEKISGVVEWIKGIFDFELTFPHIALPHFSVTGQFSADPPSVPAFEVSGYYAQGGIVDGASLIMAGEAGPEAIVPLTAPNIAPFADAVAERVSGRGDTFVFNITADSETTLQSLVKQAQRARMAYGRA